MRISDFRIGTRLALGFAVLLLITTSITGIAIWRLSNVAELTRQTLQLPLQKERLASDWHRLIALGARRSLAIAKSSDPSLEAFFAADAKETSELSFVKRDGIAKLLVSDEEKQMFEELARRQKLNLGSRAEIFKAKAEGRLDDANRLLDEVYIPNLKAYQDLMERFEELQRANIDAGAQRIDAIYATSRNQILFLGALGLACCTVLVWLLTVSITRPLHKAVEVARNVASGKLHAEIVTDRRDEAGQLLTALKEMNDNLAGIVGRVRAGTSAIASASAEIASGSTDLSSRTEEQASSLEETAASMEELTATVRQSAEHAHTANELAGAASQAAEQGGEIVSQVVHTMASITESSRRIADITSVINGLAFQTNILALNAAVEAARAGEQGRGFAVVAAEVRNLAQRSASAAKEIEGLIAASSRTVADGSALVARAGAAMTGIVDSSRQVREIMREIASGSREQSSGIAQINQAMAQMEQVTQQNATLVEQAAAAAQAMQAQAHDLSRAVQVFELGRDDERTGSPAHHQPLQPLPGRRVPLLAT